MSLAMKGIWIGVAAIVGGAGGALLATSLATWACVAIMAVALMFALAVAVWPGRSTPAPPRPPTTIYAPNARRVKATDVYSEAHTVVRGDNVDDVDTGDIDHRPR